MIELIEHGGGWRCIDDAGRISQVYDEKPRHICETNPPDWLTGLEGVVARLEWEYQIATIASCEADEEKWRQKSARAIGILASMAIARAELDRERAKCEVCKGEGKRDHWSNSRGYWKQECTACKGSGKKPGVPVSSQ